MPHPHETIVNDALSKAYKHQVDLREDTEILLNKGADVAFLFNHLAETAGIEGVTFKWSVINPNDIWGHQLQMIIGPHVAAYKSFAKPNGVKERKIREADIRSAINRSEVCDAVGTKGKIRTIGIALTYSQAFNLMREMLAAYSRSIRPVALSGIQGNETEVELE